MSDTVLVVEDERDLADLYADWLADEYDVRVAYTAQEALETVDDEVSVVLLDRRLPDRPGSEVLATIRERGLECRVAMVTAVDPDFDIVEMGFDDYLVKPVSRAELRETVDGLLSQRSYDERMREYAALARKRAVLESEKDQAKLAENEAYQELLERLDELSGEVDDLVAGFDEQAFSAAFRDLEQADE
ncbi:MAG: response regulator transcription factor [Halobacteriaceae archaeon]